MKNLGVQEGSLVLGVRNSFAQEWFRKHYLELLEDALRSLGAQNPQVSFQVLPAAQDALLLPSDPPPPPPARPGAPPAPAPSRTARS